MRVRGVLLFCASAGVVAHTACCANLPLLAGDLLKGPLQHVIAELGWNSLLRQDSRTREEVAAVHPGAFLDAGFSFRRDALWGPTLQTDRADAFWNELMQTEGQVNLYMSKSPSVSGD